MAQSTSGTFACEHCGHQYPWKASIAGKKAKCICGQVVVVPQSPAEESDPLAVFDLAEPAPETAAQTASVGRAAPAPYIPPPASRTSLEYSTPVKDRFSAEALTHAPRDIYIPTGLFIGGFLAMLIWAIVDVRLPAPALAVVALGAGVATLLKTALLIGFAIVVAPRFGVSFGLFRTAVLKFAAIIVFTDAVLLWADVLMHATGAIPASGKMFLRAIILILVMELVLTAALIAILMRILFDMDRDETAMVALPLAFLSRVIGIALGVLLAAVVAGMQPGSTASKSGGGSGAASVAPGSGGVPLPAPIPIVRTPEQIAADRELADRVAKNPLVHEARAHIESQKETVIKCERPFVEATYKAGAKKVYFEAMSETRDLPGKAYVELPSDPAQRAECFGQARLMAIKYHMGMGTESMSDTGQQFIVVSFP